MAYGVFISYSHVDVQYVSPIVKLVQAVRTDLVFQDTISIQPGKKWGPQLERALKEAQVLVLFWCKHAAESEEVKKEYTAAISQHKDILPLLLDDSKLSDELSDYQWIDLRNVIFHKSAEAESPTLSPVPDKPKGSSKLGRISVILPIAAMLLLALSLNVFRSSTSGNPDFRTEPMEVPTQDTVISLDRDTLKGLDSVLINTPKETISSGSSNSTGYVMILSALFLLSLYLFIIFYRNKQRRNAKSNLAPYSPGAGENAIAKELLEALNKKMPKGEL